MKMENKLNCPVCNSTELVRFFEKKNVPVHQNYICETEESAKNINKGDLELCICKKCGFIFNARFDDSKLQYGKLYDNTQDTSNIFSEYIDKEIRFLINTLEIKNKKIIEVGCGKGNFLKKLAAKSNSIGMGFDPSYVGETECLNKRVKFKRCFYDDNCSHIPADIVICRHVIEHVANPVSILENIRRALVSSPNAVVFFETPSVKWILENKVIYDFFYEHCSYFDEISITNAFHSAGLKVIKIISEFNKQYMWIIGEILKCNEAPSEIDYNSVNILKKLAHSYSNIVNKNIERWKDKIIDLSKNGKVAIWGAGAKGVTFVNLVDPENLYIDCVIDINVHKQGCYLPGTGHKIVNYNEIKGKKIKNIIVMNSNYLDEVDKALHIAEVKVNLVNGEDLL